MGAEKVETNSLLDTFGALKKKRTGHDDKWLRNYKRLFMYREYTSEEEEDILLGIKSDIKQPKELSHLETKRPRVINTIFSYDPIATAIPRNEESVDKAKAAEALYSILPFINTSFLCRDRCLRHGYVRDFRRWANFR